MAAKFFSPAVLAHLLFAVRKSDPWLKFRRLFENPGPPIYRRGAALPKS